MLTPDPGLKNASTWNDDLPVDSSTTMLDALKMAPDSFCSLPRIPSLSATRSGSVSDAELPLSKTVILGTSPALAGLKLGTADGLAVGAAEGLRVGATDGLGVGTAVGDMVGDGTAWLAAASVIRYCVAPPSGVTEQSGCPTQALRAAAIA